MVAIAVRQKGKLNSVSALTEVGNFKAAKALLISFLGPLATFSSIQGKLSPILIQAQNTWLTFWF